MIYQSTITTSKNTSRDNAKQTILKLTKGLVYQVEVEFPSGPSGLLHVRICDSGYQVYPSNGGEWFSSDGVKISFNDTYLKATPPYQFDIFTYNLDDTWDHICMVRIGLVSKDIFMARFLPTTTWDYFKAMLKDLEDEQKAEYEANKNQAMAQGIHLTI